MVGQRCAGLGHLPPSGSPLLLSLDFTHIFAGSGAGLRSDRGDAGSRGATFLDFGGRSVTLAGASSALRSAFLAARRRLRSTGLAARRRLRSTGFAARRRLRSTVLAARRRLLGGGARRLLGERRLEVVLLVHLLTHLSKQHLVLLLLLQLRLLL